jgi:hypothetical protein
MPTAEAQDNPKVAAALAELRDIVALIDRHTRGMHLPPDRRSRLALGCLDLAIDHQAGILVLAERGLIGPAYALLRCLVDSTVRGLWLKHCATDQDFETFIADGLRNKSFRALVDEVEAATGKPGGTLTDLRESMWSMMSDYTHTGFQHVVRRTGADFTGPNYPAQEVAGNLYMSASVGLLAAISMALAAGQIDAASVLGHRQYALKISAEK